MCENRWFVDDRPNCMADANEGWLAISDALLVLLLVLRYGIGSWSISFSIIDADEVIGNGDTIVAAGVTFILIESSSLSSFSGCRFGKLELLAVAGIASTA